MNAIAPEGETTERIQLRAPRGPLLGVLVVERAQGLTSDGIPVRVIRQLRLEVKRGRRLFEVDLGHALSDGDPVVLERVSPITALPT